MGDGVVAEEVAPGEVGLDDRHFLDGEGAWGVVVEWAGEGLEVRHDVLPGIGGDLLG